MQLIIEQSRDKTEVVGVMLLVDAKLAGTDERLYYAAQFSSAI